jgi:hypothetical protein
MRTQATLSIGRNSDGMESKEDIEGLILQLAELRRRNFTLVREANVLRREVHAWRKWRENNDASLWTQVVRARRATDAAGAFRCVDDS